jgi:hypothetical protein
VTFGAELVRSARTGRIGAASPEIEVAGVHTAAPLVCRRIHRIVATHRERTEQHVSPLEHALRVKEKSQ